MRTNSVVKILSPVSRHVKFILPTLTHAVEECKNKKREEGGKRRDKSTKRKIKQIVVMLERVHRRTEKSHCSSTPLPY